MRKHACSQCMLHILCCSYVKGTNFCAWDTHLSKSKEQAQKMISSYLNYEPAISFVNALMMSKLMCACFAITIVRDDNLESRKAECLPYSFLGMIFWLHCQKRPKQISSLKWNEIVGTAKQCSLTQQLFLRDAKMKTNAMLSCFKHGEYKNESYDFS